MADVDRVWYLRRQGQKGSVGPFNTEQLLARWQKGELDRHSEGWREGMLDWRPLLEIEPFASAARVSLDVTGVIRFLCQCNNEIVMAERFAGRLCKCSVCGRQLSVPDPYATIEPSARREAKTSGRPAWLFPVGAVAVLFVLAAVALQLLGVDWVGALAGSESTGQDRVAAATVESGPDSQTLPDTTAPDAEDASSPDQTETSSQVAVQPKPGESDAGSSSEPVVSEPSVATQQPKPTDEGPKFNVRNEERVVRRVVMDFIGIFRTRNPTPLERIEQLLAEDCVIVYDDEKEVTGRADNVLALAKAADRERGKYAVLNSRFEFETLHVYPARAVANGEFTREGTVTGSGAPVKESFEQTIILIKVESGWQIKEVQSKRLERSSSAAG